MWNWSKNSWYWQALLSMIQNQVWVFGNILIVMNSSNTDEKNFQHLQDIFTPDIDWNPRFFTSLSDAVDAAESNNNDVILLDSNSTHTLTTGLALTKSRVNFIGMDGWDRLLQQGAKIQTTDAAAVAYTLKNTGTRNSFRNIKFIMNDTDAAALNVVQEWGEWTLYKNCSFVFWVADNLDLTTSSEFLAGWDSTTMLDCTFGNDTLLTSAARTVFKIDQVTASQEFKSNIIKDCVWQISSSSADALFISMAAAWDILFTNLFVRPIFQASVDSAGWALLTKWVTTANGTTKGTINLYMPAAFNVTNLAVNGTNNDALQVYGPNMATATDFVWLAPVAT